MKCETKCEMILEELQAFIDNELPQERHNEVLAHLNECSECTRMVEELEELSMVMQKWDVPEPSLPTAQQVLAAAKPSGGIFFRFLQQFYELPFKLKAPLLAAATALVLLFISVVQDQPNLKSRPSRAPESVAVKPHSPIPNIQEESYREAAKEIEELKRDRALQDQIASSQDSSVGGGVAGSVIGGVNAPVVISPTLVTPAEAPSKPASADNVESFAMISKNSVEKQDYRVKVSSKDLQPTDRLIIKSANLTLETENFDDSKTKAAELATSNGGFVTRLQVSTQGRARVADISVKVPARNFEKVVNEIRRFGKSVQELVEGQDVTDQYLNVFDEVQSEQQLEQDVRKSVEADKSNSYEKLYAQRQLREIARQRAALERQLQQLRDGAALSTINIRLEEKSSSILAVAPGQELTVGQQIKLAFVNGFRNLFSLILPIVLFVGEAGLSIIFCSLLIYGLYWIGKKYVNKREKRVYQFSSSETRDWTK
ncbi:MAG: DUF4349 domain-containing protein [Blastocatellia bacterium]|nr:DUF4349 domain-containing protein [Blastocatellia bacterium]